MSIQGNHRATDGKQPSLSHHAAHLTPAPVDDDLPRARSRPCGFDVAGRGDGAAVDADDQVVLTEACQSLLRAFAASRFSTDTFSIFVIW